MTFRQKSTFEAEMSMTIKNIRREDLGSYICVAKNSLGDAESKIRLYGKQFICHQCSGVLGIWIFNKPIVHSLEVYM